MNCVLVEGTERIVYKGKWGYSPMPPSAYKNDDDMPGIRREFKQRWGRWFTRIVGITGRYRVSA